MLLVSFTDQMKTATPPGPKPPQRVSLVTQTAQSLRESLQSGHWQGHLPGERELSARLRVSRQTVRAALGELQREGVLDVEDRRRRRIRATRTAKKAAAHPNVIAALLPRPLLAMSLNSVVIVDEMRDHLSRAGFSLDLHVSVACFTAQPARALDALVARTPAAAWLLFGSLEPMQRWFIRKKLPCLVLGSCAPGVELPSVDVDYRAECRHAGAMLRRKGHRRIALIRPAEARGGETDGELGFREAFAEDANAMLVLRHDGTPAHICSLLDKAMRSAQPPTAYVVGRAIHVLTVMMHLMQCGKRIPQDVAVVSRDDESFLQHVTPVVTRYAANQTQFARRVSAAARQLVETGALPPQAIRLMPKLIAGETV